MEAKNEFYKFNKIIRLSNTGGSFQEEIKLPKQIVQGYADEKGVTIEEIQVFYTNLDVTEMENRQALRDLSEVAKNIYKTNQERDEKLWA